MSADIKDDALPIAGVRPLPEVTTLNGMRYRLKKRTETIAMYELLAMYSDTVIGIEVFIIPVRKPDQLCSYWRETFVRSSQFGTYFNSRAWCGTGKEREAEAHFNLLQAGGKLPAEASSALTGVRLVSQPIPSTTRR